MYIRLSVHVRMCTSRGASVYFFNFISICVFVCVSVSLLFHLYPLYTVNNIIYGARSRKSPECLHGYKNTLISSLTHSLTHTHTHARTHASTHARTHARTHVRTHARKHAPPPPHTHTHTQTHKPKDRKEKQW